MKDRSGEKLSVTRENTADHEPANPASNAPTPVKQKGGALIAELIFSALLLAAICSLRTVHVYASNVGAVAFSELAASMWGYIGISIAAFAILRIFLRKPYFAGVFVAFAAFWFVDFDWLMDFMRLFIDNYYSAAIGGIALFAVIMAGFFFLLRLLYQKSFPVQTVAQILAVTFSALVLFNVVISLTAVGKAAPGSGQAANAAATAPAAAITVVPATTAPVLSALPSPTGALAGGQVTQTPTQAAFGKPNVYFFLLDEYSSFDMLSKYYGYDNKAFNDFLQMEGFNISRESYATNNETVICASDLLNLNYISKNKSKGECEKATAKAQLFQVFSGMGYSQLQLSTNDGFFNGIANLDPSIKPDADEAMTIDGQDPSEIVSDDSIYSALTDLVKSADSRSDTSVDTAALTTWGFYPSDYIRNSDAYKKSKLKSNADTILKIFDYLETPANYSFKGPRVTYTYLMTPHVPFLFDQYGGILPIGQRINWENTDVYLNQYKYDTKHMMDILSTVIKNDPDSIIIVMSDHGIRYHNGCKLKHTFEITDKDSCRIMNAVYIKGQKYNIEGLSGVNTLRFILSLYDGLDYPPINDPITSASPDDIPGITPKT